MPDAGLAGGLRTHKITPYGDRVCRHCDKAVAEPTISQIGSGKICLGLEVNDELNLECLLQFKKRTIAWERGRIER